MILGVRRIDLDGLVGLNVFRSKDWLLPIEELGESCFAYFDDSVRKLQKDPDATRLKVPQFRGETELTLLNTASATALRSVPEKRRHAVELFSLAVFERDGERFAWSNLPAWAKIYIENRLGQVYQISCDQRKATWCRIGFESDDSFVHLSLFKDHFFSALAPMAGAAFYRTSSLISERRPDWLPAWSLALSATQARREFGEDRP